MAAHAIEAVPIEPIPETSPAERVVADVQAIGAPVAVAERVRDSVPLWFHTFALAPGVYTPGIARDHGYRLAVLGADRFAGRSVLDVGAFDGFYSFLAEVRGARRVVAVDNEQYVDWVRARFGVTLTGGAGFRAITELAASRVEYRRMDVLDVAASSRRSATGRSVVMTPNSRPPRSDRDQAAFLRTSVPPTWNAETSQRNYGVRSGRCRDQRVGDPIGAPACLGRCCHRARGDPCRGRRLLSGHGVDHRPRRKTRDDPVCGSAARPTWLAPQRQRRNRIPAIAALCAAGRRAGLNPPRSAGSAETARSECATEPGATA